MNRISSSSLLVAMCLLPATVTSLIAPTTHLNKQRVSGCTTALFANGSGGGPKGFGSSSSGNKKTVDKTYGPSARAPIKDIIDTEAAMAEFFRSNEDWSPLFRSIARSASVPAMSFLGGQHGIEIDLDDSQAPWQRLNGLPSGEENMAVVASFLDSMHQALVDIPVSNLVQEDENDKQFIEEGRRILCCTRFHVLRGNKSGSIEHHDELFMTCWSELAELRRADEADTGSIILLPDYDLADLRRFTDMNIHRPLDWLGIDRYFEVASFQRESPAIRILHKMSDIPTDSYMDE